MGLIKRRLVKPKRTRNARSVVHKLRSIISVARANRRMTRSMSKKLRFLSFSSIPLKKTSNAHQLRAKPTSVAAAATPDPAAKPVNLEGSLDQGDGVVVAAAAAAPQPTSSFVVLYETVLKPSEFNLSPSNEAMAAPGGGQPPVEDGPAGMSVDSTPLETIAGFEAPLDDDQIISDILDLMEAHGVIEHEERPRSIEEIKGDLMSDVSELREHMRGLLQLCKCDKLEEKYP